MQEPTILNFTGPDDGGAMYQGSAFEVIITVRNSAKTPVNLSTYSVRAHARKSLSDTDPAWVFTTSLVDVTENGTTYPESAIRMFVGATVNKDIPPGIYNYDIELELLADADIVVKPAVGKIRVKGEATK